MNNFALKRISVYVRGFSTKTPKNQSLVVQNEPQTCLLPIESAKALIRSRISASFISISEEEDANETISVPYILHPSWPGFPILAFDSEEEHCKNLLTEQKCALTVTNLTPSRIDHTKLPLPRVTTMGRVELITDEQEIESVLQAFEQIHSVSKEDLMNSFKFFQLKIDDLHYVNSMGEYTYLLTTDYLSCKVDPIAKHTKKVIDQISKEYSQSDMLKFCRDCSDFANLTDAFILSVDRLGVSLMACEGTDEWVELRMPFERVITDLKEYHIELTKMFENNE
jgi:hypothetical protein